MRGYSTVGNCWLVLSGGVIGLLGSGSISLSLTAVCFVRGGNSNYVVMESTVPVLAPQKRFTREENLNIQHLNQLKLAAERRIE